MTDPDTGDWTYSYEGNGNLKTQTNEEETLWFDYDLLGRITERRLDDGSGGLLAEWLYDPSGHWGLLDYSESTQGDRQVRVINVDYDARNRVTDVKYRVDVDGGSYDYDMMVGWGYDEADRVESITYPGGTSNETGDTFDYVYDSRTGRPKKLEKSTGANVVSSVTWTPQGAPLTQKWGPSSGDVFRTWEYFDDSQRTHKIQSGTTVGAHGMANLHYRYTTDGLVEQRTDWRNSDQVECFEYDDLNRLTAAFTSDEDTGNPDDCSDGYVNVGQGAYDHTYGYNPIGNLTTVDGANWSYGAGSAGPHALTGTPGASFSYDNTGRQVSRTINTVTTTLGWTPTGMTDTVTTGSDTTTT